MGANSRLPRGDWPGRCRGNPNGLASERSGSGELPDARPKTRDTRVDALPSRSQDVGSIPTASTRNESGPVVWGHFHSWYLGRSNPRPRGSGGSIPPRSKGGQRAPVRLPGHPEPITVRAIRGDYSPLKREPPARASASAGRGVQIPAASTRNEKRVRSPGPVSHFWSIVEFETRLLRGVRGSVAPPGSNGEVSGLAPPRRSAVPSSKPIQGEPP